MGSILMTALLLHGQVQAVGLPLPKRDMQTPLGSGLGDDVNLCGYIQSRGVIVYLNVTHGRHWVASR